MPFVPAEYDWLALRFDADRKSRDPALLARVSAALAGRSRVRVLDLGAGAGANLLYLAPRLPVAEQEWTLVDRDTALVERVDAYFDAFARPLPGMVVDRGRLGFGAVTATYRALTSDFLDRESPIYREPWDLVVANAVFDLLSADQFGRLIELMKTCWAGKRPPLYFTINLDRTLAFDPVDDDDVRMIALFHAHMQREQAFGRAMGPDSARDMLRLLGAHGLDVEAAASSWRATSAEPAFLHANLDFVASATRELIAAGQGSGVTFAQVDAWLAHKRGLIEAGALTMEVAHQDIWATWR